MHEDIWCLGTVVFIVLVERIAVLSVPQFTFQALGPRAQSSEATVDLCRIGDLGHVFCVLTVRRSHCVMLSGALVVGN